MSDLLFDSGYLFGKPEPDFENWPRVMIIHDIYVNAETVSSRMIDHGLFPYSYTSINGALNSKKARECVGILMHKDIPGGIEYFLRKLDFPGAELIRKGVISGEFFTEEVPGRCVKFLKENNIDFGYDMTGWEGTFPDWVAQVLKFGLLTPEELKLRGTDNGIITSAFRAGQRAEFLEAHRHPRSPESE